MQYKEVILELQLIKKLLAAQLLRDCSSQADKVHQLSRLGFSTGEVADLLGMKSKDVSAYKAVKKSRQRRKDGTHGGETNP